jgi:hypothetical protein
LAVTAAVIRVMLLLLTRIRRYKCGLLCHHHSVANGNYYMVISVKIILFIIIIFSGSAAQCGLWPLHFMRFLDHTHNDMPQSVGLLWMSDQLIRDLYLTTHTTNIHVPGGVQTHDRSTRAAIDLNLRPRGHWDRR